MFREKRNEIKVHFLYFANTGCCFTSIIEHDCLFFVCNIIDHGIRCDPNNNNDRGNDNDGSNNNNK